MRCSPCLPLAASLLALAACSLDAEVGRVERCALGVHAEALAPLETEVGRGFDLERTFHRWDDAFPDDRERASADAGRAIIASFTGRRADGTLIPFARIADPGDAQLASELAAMAARVRDFGRPIYLVFHDEADNDAAFGTPEEFAAAWRRVVTAFREAGADNAIWIWSLSSKAYPSRADAWYPGDAYVDWLGVTGFNWYTGDPVSPWRTFASIFASFVEWAGPHPQPLMIVSTASGENPSTGTGDPRSKPTWIREALATIEATPRLQALVWYSRADTDDPHKDWRLDSSPAALDAFRALATDPHFDTSARTPP